MKKVIMFILFPCISYLDAKLNHLYFIILFQAVTKAKLGYDPIEVNPEDMVRFAKEEPQV